MNDEEESAGLETAGLVSSRRAFCAGLFATIALSATPAWAARRAAGLPVPDPGPRRLDIKLLETGDRFSGPYYNGLAYDQQALLDLSVVLGDRRTGECHPIDPKVLDIAWQISDGLRDRQLVCLSGFRSPRTNKRIGGAQHSYHLTGQALDLMLPPRALALQARVARKLGGGVGRYRHFLHVDSGPQRYWAMLQDRPHTD
jgi:uncharacterized protein YcbK (DUF882 family)